MAAAQTPTDIFAETEKTKEVKRPIEVWEDKPDVTKPRYRNHSSIIAEVLAIVGLAITVPITLTMCVLADIFGYGGSILGVSFATDVGMLFAGFAVILVAMCIMLYWMVYSKIVDADYDVAYVYSLVLLMMSIFITLIGFFFWIGLVFVVQVVIFTFLWIKCGEAIMECQADQKGLTAEVPRALF